MSFQTDGNGSLGQQELQLQALETFFVEVIDFQAGPNLRNEVGTKDIALPTSGPLQLRTIQSPSELAQMSAAALAIVFDRVVFIAGQRERVIGFRAP